MISELPDFGSLALSKSVAAALTHNHCGHDLIVLASFLSSLNIAPKLSALPFSMQSSDGDFMVLIKVMNAVLDERRYAGFKNTSCKTICQKLGLSSIQHLIKRALRRYDALMRSIKLSGKYHRQAILRSDNWEMIARSLLFGYEDHVFVSMKELYGRLQRYLRYQSQKEEYAVLDHKSMLYSNAKADPVPIILARDIHYSTSIRDRAVLSFLGRIQPEWVMGQVHRRISINATELQKCQTDGILNQIQSTYPNLQVQFNHDEIVLRGPFSAVYDSERFLLQSLVVPNVVRFQNEFDHSTAPDDHQRMQQNLALVSKMRHIFKPMEWRYKNEAQAKLIVANASSTSRTCQVNIRARDKVYQVVLDEITSFIGWLKNSAVVRSADHGKTSIDSEEFCILSFLSSSQSSIDESNDESGASRY